MASYKIVNIIKDKKTKENKGFYCVNIDNLFESLYIKEELINKSVYKSSKDVLHMLSLFKPYKFSIETYRREQFILYSKPKVMYEEPNIEVSIKINDPDGLYKYFYRCSNIDKTSNIIKTSENILYTLLFPSLPIESIQFSSINEEEVKYALCSKKIDDEIIESLRILGEKYNFRVALNEKEPMRWKKDIDIISLYCDNIIPDAIIINKVL